MNAELIALAEELTKEVDENYDGYLIQDLAKEAAAMLRKMTEQKPVYAVPSEVTNDKGETLYTITDQPIPMADNWRLYSAPVAVAEQEPAVLADLTTSEPRLVQLCATLTHGQELYAAPVAASPEFVAEAMRLAEELVRRVGKSNYHAARAALQAHLEKP